MIGAGVLYVSLRVALVTKDSKNKEQQYQSVWCGSVELRAPAGPPVPLLLSEVLQY